MRIGSTPITDIKVGSTPITKVIKDGVIYWELDWTPQEIVDTFLFYGETSKISGGRLNNQVLGSSDYLTVSGSAGSEVYTCPVNDDYKTADTDSIWFKSDKTARSHAVYTSELIGYDLQRTPVKFDDSSPNTIRIIGILKEGVTPIANQLFSLFHLPVMWSNSLNLYGHIKDNRGATQQLWTPAALYADETIALLARFDTQPTSALATLIDKTITDLKTATVYSHIDCLKFYGLHTEQARLLNWIGNFSNSTLISAPVHTEKIGYIGATGKFINSNYNPTINGINYTQDSAFFGAYVIDELADAADVMGVGLNAYLRPRGNSGSSYRTRAYVNVTAVPIQNPPATSVGLTIAVRENATQVWWYKNGGKGDVDSDNSVAIPNTGFFELRSVLATAYTARLACTVYGGGTMTNTMHLALYDIIKYFINNVGGTF